MPERVFLTDARRDVLNGEFDGADATRYSHKSRIRTRAQMALEELIEVAESPEIDNRDVFEQEQVQQLLRSLFVPPAGSDAWDEPPHGLIGPGDETLTPEYRTYTDRLYVQIDTLLRDYQTTLVDESDESDN